MEKLPESLYGDYQITGKRTTDSDGSGSGAPNVVMLCRWIKDLQFPASRESALHNLANNRDVCEDMAVLLWKSFGTISTLLYVVTGSYPELSSSTLNQRASNRVYNVLLLFKCIAEHPETRMHFIKAMMPHYLYPFLDTRDQDSPHDYLRLGSLGVIATLVKAEDDAILRFLINSEVVRYCIQSIEMGSMSSKTVATYIVQKILLTNEGLKHCCALAERYFAIDHALRFVLDELAVAEKPSQDLFKFVVTCYLRLSSKPRAREGLKRYVPSKLVDNTFIKLLRKDPAAMDSRMRLLQNIEISNRGSY